MTHSHPSWPWWRRVIACLSALALVLSSYLGWHSLMGGEVIGCGGGSPCEEVLTSKWSAIGGVLPVSGLAAGAYLAMLVANLFIGPETEAPVRRLAWRAMLVLVGAAAGSAVWFTILQKWVIRSFCPYCMATHVTGLLLAALVIWRAPLQSDGEPTQEKQLEPQINTDTHRSGDGIEPEETGAKLSLQNNLCSSVSICGLRFRRLPAIGAAFIGVALAGILVACQVALASKPVSRVGESRADLPVLDPHAVPLVGSSNATCIVELLFDYKCPHCQRLHGLVDEVVRRYNGKLAFALCPAPLNTECNPYIPRDVDEFKDSCELARLSLAVWVANREAFATFDHWMFSADPGDVWHPRTLDDARAKAAELVGQSKFDAALSDPWIDQYMQTSIQIFGDTLQGGNAVPKLVYAPRWVSAEPNDANDLLSILHDSLAVPRP